MPGFYGKYYYRVDLKGRVTMPPIFIEIIRMMYRGKLVIINSLLESCLQIYPLEIWMNLLERIKSVPDKNDAVEYFIRRYLGSAMECKIDKQGKVFIPPALREDAGININEDVVIVGQGDKIEIWDRNKFEAKLMTIEQRKGTSY